MADSAVSPVRPDSPSDLDVLTSMNLAFDLSPVAMILVDDALRIVKANPAAHQMLAADPLIGRSVTEFSVAENVDRADRRESVLAQRRADPPRTGDRPAGGDRGDLAGRRPAGCRRAAVRTPLFPGPTQGRHRGTAAGTRTGRQRGAVPAVGGKPPRHLGDAVRSRPAADRRLRRGVGRQRLFQRPGRHADAGRVPGVGHGPAGRSLSRRARRPGHRLHGTPAPSAAGISGPGPARCSIPTARSSAGCPSWRT